MTDISITHFDQNSFELQKEAISSASFKEKGDLILRCQSPKDVVQDLSLDELFLIYSEAPSEVKGELVPHASQEQLDFIGDFECWEKDKISKEGFIDWLNVLVCGDHERVQDWVLNADLEILIAGFSKVIEVIKTEHLELIDDYVGDRPFFTLDNLYYLCIGDEAFSTIRRVVEVLFEKKQFLYLQLMEGLICSSEDEVVEAAFRLKTERLAQEGFPSMEEALLLFRPLSDWSHVEERIDSGSEELEEHHFLERGFPLAFQKGKNFLDDVFTYMKPEQEFIDRLQVEMAHLANKVLVCEQLDFRYSENTFKSFRTIQCLVALGLEDLSHSSLEIARDLLHQYWIEDLFRWGFSRLYHLKQMTKKFIHLSPFKTFDDLLQFLGAPWDSTLRGLVYFIPKKRRPFSEYELDEFENFESLKDIEEVYLLLKELYLIMESLLNLPHHEFFDTYKEASLMLSPLLGSMFINYVLEEPLHQFPIPIHQFKSFLSKAFERPSDGPAYLKDSLKEGFIHLFIASQEEGLNLEFFQAFFKNLEEELSDLSMEGEVDALLLRKVYLEDQA